MRIILIGNYLKDKQQSMIRFTEMLGAGYISKGIQVETWIPPAFLGALVSNTQSGPGKWLGYFDKWVLFPLLLKLKLIRLPVKHDEILFHICDHSNAPYIASLPLERTVITCHDVLAIKSALGYADTYCKTSRFGHILQNWIFKNLSKARFLICVSQFTAGDLNEILPPDNNRRIQVILNAFNDSFYPMPVSKASLILEPLNLKLSGQYILHIGGGHQRKNRNMLIEMVALLKEEWAGMICFAGEELNDELKLLTEKHQLTARVISLGNINHQTLVALYSNCFAFIFPSFSEGFGWPLIEAQACGAPVLTSRKEPMPEVTGGAALFADPLNAADFKAQFMNLLDPEYRNKLIIRGYSNSHRFDPVIMLNAYIEFYDETLVNPNTGPINFTRNSTTTSQPIDEH